MAIARLWQRRGYGAEALRLKPGAVVMAMWCASYDKEGIAVSFWFLLIPFKFY
jgi:hypothetical protein